MRKTLIVVAHPDDEVLGCGGTMAWLAAKGENVKAIIFTQGHPPRNDNIISQVNEAANTLGVIPPTIMALPDQRLASQQVNMSSILVGIINSFQPETIYTHSRCDLNSDHRTVLEAVLVATRPGASAFVQRLYSFHVPSSTEWAFGQYGDFRPNTFVDISEQIRIKLKALQCYEDEVREFPHPRSERSLLAISQTWGSHVGLEYAEAFELIREVR